MGGFCLGCPVPENLAAIESGNFEACRRKVFTDEGLRKPLIDLVTAIAETKYCTEGPVFDGDYSNEESYVICSHPRWDTFAKIADSLLTDDGVPSIDIVGRVVKKESTV